MYIGDDSKLENDERQWLLIILRLQYHNEKNWPYFKEKKSKVTRKGERENRSGRSWNFFRPEFRVFLSLMDISEYFIVFTKE